MNEGENCNIFLTFNNIISRPRLHYYIDSRSIGDPMDRSRFPERLSGSWPASARPAATFFGHGDRSHGEITAIYGRQQVPSQMPPHLPRNFSDATWQGRYVLARPLLSRRSCDSFRSLFCLLLLRFISPDVRKPRASQVKFADLLNSFRGKLEARSFIGSHVCGHDFYPVCAFSPIFIF